MAPRMPVGARRADVSADGRRRRRQRVERRLAELLTQALGERRVIASDHRSRSRRIGQRGARDPRRSRGRRLPLGVARRHRARPRRRDASRRSGDRHARRERRGRRVPRSSTGTSRGSSETSAGPPTGSVIPYTPLQPGEIDQGQFDRVIEVLCVSTCAMLISRDAWQRVGAVRRAAGHPPRGSRLLLARPSRRLPRADDAARARPSSRRVRGRRTTPERAIVGRSATTRSARPSWRCSRTTVCRRCCGCCRWRSSSGCSDSCT